MIRLDTDASTFAIAGIMSQQDEKGQWRPVAFASRKLEPAERNYEVYDCELMAIVFCFKQWRHYLDGAQHTIQVYTDHDNLRGIRGVRKLNPRQARWAMLLAGFDFEVHHQAGKTNPADGPSRRPDYYTESDAVNSLLPTLQRKVRLSTDKTLPECASAFAIRAKNTATVAGKHRSSSAPRGVAEHTDEGLPDPESGIAGCTQRVPRHTARLLLSDEPT